MEWKGILTMQKGLPGMGVDEKKLKREKRLLRWFKDRGWDLITDVARVMGIHRTFPGKCLIACTDPLTCEMRRKLLAAGVPDNLLPPGTEPKRAQGGRCRRWGLIIVRCERGTACAM